MELRIYPQFRFGKEDFKAGQLYVTMKWDE